MDTEAAVPWILNKSAWEFCDISNHCLNKGVLKKLFLENDLIWGSRGWSLAYNKVKRNKILRYKKLDCEINIEKKSYIFKYERNDFLFGKHLKKSQYIWLNIQNSMLQKINKILKYNLKFNDKNTL